MTLTPAKRLRARQDAPQTASTGEPKPSYAQPSTTLALSTTFTPAASCASNKLTMLPPPRYFIWANEPVPFTNTTVTNCYPPEFLRSYTSVTSGDFPSSIVPVMSPLVCPQNFCTQFVADDNYIACCPSGYSLAPPATPHVRDRPAYGGTCYSPLSVSSTVTLLQYDAAGSTQLVPLAATTTGTQAYAHPIDGFAATAPRVGCAVLASSSAAENSTSTHSASPTAAPAPSGLSGGAIAGIVIGSVCGLGAVCFLVFVVLVRRRRAHRAERQDRKVEIHQADDGFARKPPEELRGVEKYAYEESGGENIHEMNAVPVHELSGVPAGVRAWSGGAKYEDEKQGT